MHTILQVKIDELLAARETLTPLELQEVGARVDQLLEEKVPLSEADQKFLEQRLAEYRQSGCHGEEWETVRDEILRNLHEQRSHHD